MFCKKGVLKNFTKFTEKHQCQSLFFKKVAGLRPEHLWWLLLLKDLSDVEMFKSEEIRKWEPRQCECTLCLSYVHNISYVNISNS